MMMESSIRFVRLFVKLCDLLRAAKCRPYIAARDGAMEKSYFNEVRLFNLAEIIS